MGVHDGHRERLKNSYTEHGLESMNDITALELLLFYAVPRRDTNELAHRLIDHFGTLSGVFQASLQELQEVKGVGESAAILLTLIPQMMKKSAISETHEMKQIFNSKDAASYMIPRFMNESDEVLLMLCMDSKRAVICCCEVGRGVVNGIDVNVRFVVEKAMKVRASSVIIAHNHPSGSALPSREDDMFTKRLYNSLALVGIVLEDHLIIVNNDYVSVADSGLMQLYRF